MSNQITQTEFQQLSKLIYDIAGIVLNDSKKILLTGRLGKRLDALGLATYTQYIKHVKNKANEQELRFMVDLLTTNETYFFREPQHFDYLKNTILPEVKAGSPFRVWSAAASTGAEAYTIAMVVADKLGLDADWEIYGSDISHSVLELARRGLYKMDEKSKIPTEYLKKYCLKGVREQEGYLLMDSRLRQHMRFEQMNLNVEKLRKPGDFDVIFLRNMLIYFDVPTKKRVVENLIPALKPQGYFIVGHSETLNGVTNLLTQTKPTIYRR
jgi:chemotaxis protein methyltransferase CheR